MFFIPEKMFLEIDIHYYIFFVILEMLIIMN